MKWEQICTTPAELKLASVDINPTYGPHHFSWHKHPFFEWGLVLEGDCLWQIGSESHALTQNEMILVPQGMIHREVIAEKSRAQLSWIGFSSQMDGKKSDTLQASNPQLRLKHSDLQKQPAANTTAYFRIPKPPNAEHNLSLHNLKPLKIALGRWQQEIRQLFFTIYKEQSESAFGSETRIGLCLNELLLLVTRILLDQSQSTALSPQTPHKSDTSLQQVQLAHAASRFLNNNTEQGITIEAVARHFRLTPQYFSTLFRKVHGQSPARYQQHARLSKACQLLIHTQCSIKEIAAQCGYADSAHFCRQFKQHECCSPTQYRLRKASTKA